MNKRVLAPCVFVAVAWVAFIWLWAPAPLALTVDDSYYYFGIANHLARGDGFSFDGIEPTTGFHPLWLLLLAPFVRVVYNHPDAGVRAILTVQVAMVGFPAWRLSRGRPAVLICFAGFALVFHFTKIFVNGLESALELVLLVFAIEAAEEKRDLRLGILGAALTLARSSALPAAAMLLLAAPRPRLAWALFAAPIASYVLVLFVATGHPFPISGAIKYGHGPIFTPLTITVTLAALAASVVAVRRKTPIWLAPLVICVAVQTTADALLRYRFVPEVWYFVPHATLFVLVIAHNRRIQIATTVIVLGASIPLWRERFQPESYAFYVEARTAGQWLAENTPPDAHIAGWDAGITAFYSRRAFTNLDGLAASWDYKTNYRDRGRTRAYLDDRHIDWIAQDVPEGTELVSFHDVDLHDWSVVYDRPFVFRGILNWADGPLHRRFVVLRRN